MQMIKKILLFFIILLSLSACDKAFVNGDLDGMWRLEKVVYGGEEELPENIYFSFQRHIVMFGRYYSEGAPFLYMGAFAREEGKITINGFKEYPGIADVCDESVLESFYIYDAEGVVFDVESLGDEYMVLVADNRVYSFRKW
mgnify:FL=1